MFNGLNLLKKNNTVMERYFIILLSVLCLSGCRAKEAEYDVCIYGGTSSGVVAAYSAAQKGLDVVLVEPSEHIGGMTTGGLGYTDIGNKQVVKGIAKQFYRKVGEHYGQLEQWIFEPGVASSIFKEYLSHRRITVLRNDSTCQEISYRGMYAESHTPATENPQSASQETGKSSEA